MQNTILYKGWKCLLEKREFLNGGFRLNLVEARTGDPIDVLNVWLPGLQPDEVALDTNNCGDDLPQLLERAGVIYPECTQRIRSGFCLYPVYKLTYDAV